MELVFSRRCSRSESSSDEVASLLSIGVPHSRIHIYTRVPVPIPFPTLSAALLGGVRSNRESRPHESISIVRTHRHLGNGGHVPVGVVHLGILAEQLLLTSLISPVSSDLIAVFFRLQEGNQVDAGPHLLAGEFAGGLLAVICDVLS